MLEATDRPVKIRVATRRWWPLARGTRASRRTVFAAAAARARDAARHLPCLLHEPSAAILGNQKELTVPHSSASGADREKATQCRCAASSEHGFTLIELLIVVAILGIVSALAVANLVNAHQRARQRRTVADMRSVATAVEAAIADPGVVAMAAEAVEIAKTGRVVAVRPPIPAHSNQRRPRNVHRNRKVRSLKLLRH